MKVVFLITGSGGSFYCSNCYRDMLFFRAVKKYGRIEAEAVPLYLPPEKIYVESGFGTNVYFGAVSLFLREKVPALHNMPVFLEKIFDSPPLLKIAAMSAGSTRSSGLEEMTINMIDSSSRIHERELERLALHLKDIKADIVHLSNSLIIGLAKQLKEIIDIKVVCSLQNEDDWINDMAEPYQSKAWELIGKESANVDVFVSPGTYFTDFITRKTGISRDKILIVPAGIEVPQAIIPEKKQDSMAVGFFSRVSQHNGFDKMVDAFLILKKEKEFKNLKLHVCGGYTGDDKPFIKQQISKINKRGLRESVRFFHEFHGNTKEDFLNSADLISVPVRKPDGYGLYILEANAHAVPVVQPATGAFPEILSVTEGGVIYEPDTVEKLAESISMLLQDSTGRKALGIKGRKNVNEKLNIERMSEGLLRAYRMASGSE
ncbi:MAG TPA: glycosyltransferase family 4 protein [Bacteroidales bacterium]|nr:glycosyltransferase family 4 protein [Bacteroidales bacterium]HRR93368.1 glycosyltransferase family 4 protein [Bacteroidales bacterium]HRT88954.1 glycosyltransferase family 4 protein [Bacteroidales bacterium]